MKVMYSLPKAQQHAAKVVRLLQAALFSMLKQTDNARPHDSDRENSSAMETLTVNFLLMLGRMSDSYELERDAFLKQVQGSRAIGTESTDTGNGRADAPDDATAAKRPRMGSASDR